MATSDGVPLVSAHSGISGSKYDKLIPKPLSGLSIQFGAAVQFAISRKTAPEPGDDGPDGKSKKGGGGSGGGGGAGRGDAGKGPDPTADLEDLIAKRRAELEAVGGRDGSTSVEQVPRGSMRLGSLADWSMDADHLSTLKTVFDFLDSDGDGELNDEELRVAVTAVGVPPTWPFLKKIKSACEEGHGVTFPGFVAALEDKFGTEPLQVAAIEKLFQNYETMKGSGYVQAFQIRHVLSGVQTAYGTHLSDEEVDEIMRELDIAEGDYVDYKHFVLALTSGFVQFDR